MDGPNALPEPPPPHLPSVLFVAPAPDHAPPESLTDDELADAIQTLQRKLHSARRSLVVADVAGGVLTLVIIVLGFIVLWAGPEPFLEKIAGQRRVATTYDIFLWWLALIVLAVLGGAFGDQVLRGRLRLARGWRHRVHHLERRLQDAEHVRRNRAGA